MTYNDIYNYVTNNLIYEQSEHHGITAIYARNANELEVIALHAMLGHSYEGYTPEFEYKPFNGPDWYFDIYKPGSQEGPGEARLESLSERKERFQKMVKKYDDIVAGWGSNERSETNGKT